MLTLTLCAGGQSSCSRYLFKDGQFLEDCLNVCPFLERNIQGLTAGTPCLAASDGALKVRRGCASEFYLLNEFIIKVYKINEKARRDGLVCSM